MGAVGKARVRAEQLYSRRDTAKLLGVSVDTVDKPVRKRPTGKPGGLRPVYRIGRLTRIPETAIEEMLRVRRIV